MNQAEHDELQTLLTKHTFDARPKALDWLSRQTIDTPPEPQNDTERPTGSDLRTSAQNRAEHAWFRDVAKACLEQGATIQDILRPSMDLQVDEGFIKWMFRRIGKKKYGKESTADHTKLEVNAIQDELINFFATKVDPPIELPPWPSDESKKENNLTITTRAKAMDYPIDPYEGKETGTFDTID